VVSCVIDTTDQWWAVVDDPADLWWAVSMVSDFNDTAHKWWQTPAILSGSGSFEEKICL
jgi:hypothetical protein